MPYCFLDTRFAWRLNGLHRWLLASGLALALVATAYATSTLETGTHAFDAAQSQAEFNVRTLWLSSVRGRFDHVSGFLRVDEDDKISVFAWVDMDELRMENTRYTKTLRSAEFFDVEEYHDMRFRSAPFARVLLGTGGGIRGWLTLRGQTRPVRFELTAGHCERPLRDPCVLNLRGSIDRTDFGMTAHGLTVSNRVRLRLKVVLAQDMAES